MLQLGGDVHDGGARLREDCERDDVSVVVVPGSGVCRVLGVPLHVVQVDAVRAWRDPQEPVPQHRSSPALDVPGDQVPEVVPRHGLVPGLVQVHHALVLLLRHRSGLLVQVLVKDRSLDLQRDAIIISITRLCR